jgi:hypothetical protein
MIVPGNPRGSSHDQRGTQVEGAYFALKMYVRPLYKTDRLHRVLLPEPCIEGRPDRRTRMERLNSD